MILGKDQPLEGVALLLCPLAEAGKLGGLAGPVGALNDDQSSLPAFPRFLLSFLASTRKRGSFAMRPMRLGWWIRR